MNSILAAQLIKLANRDVTKEMIMSLHEGIGASYTIDEIDMFLSCMGSKSLEDLEEEGRRMMSDILLSAPVQAPPQSAVEEPPKETQREEDVEDEDEEDFDLFGAF